MVVAVVVALGITVVIIIITHRVTPARIISIRITPRHRIMGPQCQRTIRRMHTTQCRRRRRRPWDVMVLEEWGIHTGNRTMK